MLTPSTPTDRQLTASASEDHQSEASAPGAASKPRARVIEFYVPATFQRPERRWVPPETRGKLIEFPGRGVRKSA